MHNNIQKASDVGICHTLSLQNISEIKLKERRKMDKQAKIEASLLVQPQNGKQQK